MPTREKIITDAVLGVLRGDPTAVLVRDCTANRRDHILHGLAGQVQDTIVGCLDLEDADEIQWFNDFMETPAPRVQKSQSGREWSDPRSPAANAFVQSIVDAFIAERL